jgi:hypothetical protein
MMHRYGRLAAAVGALLAVVALLSTVHAASLAQSEHSAGHGSGHSSDAVVLCVATGACVLAVVGIAVAVRHLVQRPVWLLGTPLIPAMPFIPAPAVVFSRAGPPPPLLQVFRF